MNECPEGPLVYSPAGPHCLRGFGYQLSEARTRRSIRSKSLTRTRNQ